MQPVTYVPQSPLAEFVDLLWSYDGAGPGHGRERVLPTGTLELVVDLRPGGAGPLICGPYSEPFVIRRPASVFLVGVHFKPGGALPFFDLPAGELRNQQVSLETLWGRDAVALRDELLAADTRGGKLRALERRLRERATRSQGRHPAVGHALGRFQARDGAATVTTVAAEAGLSARRFIQVFTDAVGLTPKLFAQVMRFQTVLRGIQVQPEPDWAQVALAAGYYDQSHLVRDFLEFSGFSPTAYLRARTSHLSHVPLAD